MYKALIQKLQKELKSKNSPGPILDEIMFRRLSQFSEGYKINKDLLMIGALLGDIRIDEARAMGDKERHIELALAYAEDLFKEYKTNKSDQEVVREIISTHHGGRHKYMESKIYKNADNFKFLETRGCMHFFGVVYTDHTPDGIEKAVNTVKKKLDEKLGLTDLDERTIEEAERLYDYNNSVLESINEGR